VAIDDVNRPPTSRATPALFIALGLFLLAAAGLWFWPAPAPTTEAALTPDAKAYLANLPLEDIGMTIAEAFGGGKLLEIKGKIGNSGPRVIRRAEVFCVFRDAVGQIVLKQRWPIVDSGLKPNETKPFRLPFDTVPDTWNQQLPNVVIASITFE